MSKALDDIIAERARQKSIALGGDTAAHDAGNSRNDWIACVNAYTGRAAEKVFRNEREGLEFRANMVKAAATIMSAIEAHDAGNC